MKRRNVLLGLGAATAGSGAIFGSGAFSSVRVDRDLSITEVDDSNANLILDPVSEDYANTDGNSLGIEFNELNPDADTTVRNVFRVKNNGDRPVRVQFQDPGSATYDELSGSPLAIGVSEDEISASDGLGAFDKARNSSAPGYWNNTSSSDTNDFEVQDLAVGDGFYVHMFFFLNDTTSELESDSVGDIPNELGIYAASDVDLSGLEES